MTDRPYTHKRASEEFNAFLEEFHKCVEMVNRGESHMDGIIAVTPEASEPVGDGEGAVELTDLHPVYKDESKAIEEAIARFNAKWESFMRDQQRGGE